MMINRCLRIVTLGLALLTNPVLRAAQVDSAQRLRAIQEELLSTTKEDDQRVRRQDFINVKLGEVKRIIREEILRQLNRGMTERATLTAGLPQILTEDGNGPISIIHRQLRGHDVVIVGYTVRHGPSALPDSTAVIEAFRKSLDRYELVDQTGQELANSLPVLEELQGPWTDEIWFIGHGQQTGVMQYHERIGIYSFDGTRFKLLWSHDPLRNASLELQRNEVKITYVEEEGTPWMVLRLALLPRGPTQISLLQKQ
jgi:hypothetical protein